MMKKKEKPDFFDMDRWILNYHAREIEKAEEAVDHYETKLAVSKNNLVYHKTEFNIAKVRYMRSRLKD